MSTILLYLMDFNYILDGMPQGGKVSLCDGGNIAADGFTRIVRHAGFSTFVKSGGYIPVLQASRRDSG